jgi:hypothetical protein
LGVNGFKGEELHHKQGSVRKKRKEKIRSEHHHAVELVFDKQPNKA